MKDTINQIVITTGLTALITVLFILGMMAIKELKRPKNEFRYRGPGGEIEIQTTPDH